MPDGDGARVPDDEVSVRPAGQFRLYLGSAAGVGKTCAMLDEGWRRHQRGTDVVIGLVETHGRAHTAEFIRDLPEVPRKTIGHRGSEFTELDLQGVLDRRPEVVLIDELAHTNVPGSGPHEKRWEDVLEILEAGIAVISTVNIQHVESLADAVERITGVAIRERVPDWVVRKADQLELIDSSADQLRRRMLHGNIYPAPRVPAALNGFFRTENLVALRELALRFVADEADEELLRYLASQHPGEVWETAERIMVAVSASPEAEAVVHRAARIASRVKGDLLAGHVVTEGREDPERLARLRRLVDDVGGAWHEIPGDDAAKAIVAFAREHQITQIVFGARRLTRLGELRRGSAVRRLLREAADAGIDVHVIARNGHRGKENEDGAKE